MGGERGWRQVVRRPVGEVARRVEVAHDRGLALDDRTELLGHIEREDELGPVGVAALVQTWVVGAVARSFDEGACLLLGAQFLGARLVSPVERPRDRAARAAQRPRRGCRGRAKRVCVSRRCEANAQVVPVAAHLARPETTIGLGAHVGACLPPDLDPHTEARSYRGIRTLVTKTTLRAHELRPPCR